MLHQVVFNTLGRFIRPRYTTQINFLKTLSIFVVQYLNSAIIIIVAFNSFLFSEVTIAKNKETDYIVGPFDEFDERWFLVVGTTVGLVIIVQLVTPHIPLLVMFLVKLFKQFHDRRYSLNARSTRQVNQKDYEDLYIGPKFILQIRYAQSLSVMFLILTFSSAMPLLYLAGFIHFFFTFWMDKFLLLRYYRLTEGYTAKLSKNIIRILPIAVILHLLFGLVLISNRNLLQSTIYKNFWLGNNSKYFHS